MLHGLPFLLAQALPYVSSAVQVAQPDPARAKILTSTNYALIAAVALPALCADTCRVGGAQAQTRAARLGQYAQPHLLFQRRSLVQAHAPGSANALAPRKSSRQ